MADPIKATVVPGYMFQDDEVLTPAILRAIANPQINLALTVGAAAITPGAIDDVSKLGPALITGAPLANPLHVADNILTWSVVRNQYEHTTVAQIAQIGLGTLPSSETFTLADSIVVNIAGVMKQATSDIVLNGAIGGLWSLNTPGGSTAEREVNKNDVLYLATANNQGNPATVEALFARIGLEANTFASPATELDPAADQMLVWDASAATNVTRLRRVSVKDFQVASQASVFFESDPAAIPPPRGLYSPAGTPPSGGHKLAARPRRVWGVLRCKTDDLGYLAGEEVPLEYVAAFDSAVAFNLWANQQTIGVVRGSEVGVFVLNNRIYTGQPLTGAYTEITNLAKWEIVLRAQL